MGRPRLHPNEFRQLISIRLRPKNLERLRRVAAARGASTGQIVDYLIETSLKRTR